MITIYKGDTASTMLSVTDNNGPKDLVGFDCKLLIKHSFESNILLASLDADINSDLVNGNLIFNLTKNDSEKIPPGNHVYTIYVENDAERITLIVDKFFVRDSLFIASDPDAVLEAR